MRTINALKQKLEYLRFTHLAMIVTAATVIYLTVTLPHKWWILLTALIVSSGIHPGLIVKRSIFRIKGTLLALIFLLPVLYLLQLNYRLISILFILSLIGLTVTSLNPRRYDITVFCITIFVFFLTAFSNVPITPEGPFQMVLNRGICTIIGVIIVLSSDYFLFNSFHYSRRLYNLHRLMVIDFFQREYRFLKSNNEDSVNSFLFIQTMRKECNELFTLIGLSSENLQAELRSDAGLLGEIAQFQEVIWELRRVLFSWSYTCLVVKSPKLAQAQREDFLKLLREARQLVKWNL